MAYTCGWDFSENLLGVCSTTEWYDISFALNIFALRFIAALFIFLFDIYWFSDLYF